MDQTKSTLERAFQLAGSGECRSVDEIRRVLNLEGYAERQLDGSAIKRQLRSIIENAREARRNA